MAPLLWLVILAVSSATAAAAPRKLLVISIDGLDHRYLKDRDTLKLRIPNLRKLVKEGAWADGVVGVVPTNTWPSHTTLITGVRVQEHGILDNNIQTAKGSERYWYTSYLKAPTLWQVVKKAGRKVAAITWPVTVGDGIDYNLPEYFQGRSGGAMDLASIESKATPGLVEAITKDHPSFPTAWMDDRARTLATIHILKTHEPDLTLLHFVDLDSAAHDAGPFAREAQAMLEYTDELLGRILRVVPANMTVALVSDHGFEAVTRELNVSAFLAPRKVPPETVTVRGGFVVSSSNDASAAFRQSAADTGACIGREIPHAEVQRFLPEATAASHVFESSAGCYFILGKPDGPVVSPVSTGKGRHGHWPTRYRATFLLHGAGIKPRRMPEMNMLDAVRQFASVLELAWREKAR